MYYSCQMRLYCTSLVLHIWLNELLYLLNVNALTRFLRLQTTEWEMLNHVSSICLRETLLLMKLKQCDQYQNLFEFVQKEHQPNAIYYKMMEHLRWAKYFATCNTIESFSELIKIGQFYFSVMARTDKDWAVLLQRYGSALWQKDDAMLLATGFATVSQIASDCQMPCYIINFCYS